MDGTGGKALARRTLLVLLGLALIEVAFRVASAVAGSPAAEVARIADEIEGWKEPAAGDGEEPEPSTRTLHPYVGWANENWERRYGELVPTFSDDIFEVLVMGGSVAAHMVGFSEGEIDDALAGDPRLGGRQVRVMHVARGSFKQPQQLQLLAYLLSIGWRPDVVVEYDGFNELALAVQNGMDFAVHPLHPAFFMWGPLLESSWSDPELEGLRHDVLRQEFRARDLADSLARIGLDRSAVLSRFALARMRAIRRRFHGARDAYLQGVRAHGRERETAGPPYDSSFEGVLDLAVRNWFESSRSMHALCEARDITYLHVLQPTLHDVGSKPLTPEEVEAGRALDSWVRAIRLGYPLLRREGDRLREEGVFFHDASYIFAEDTRTRYTDPCHVTRETNELLAADVGRALLEILP